MTGEAAPRVTVTEMNWKTFDHIYNRVYLMGSRSLKKKPSKRSISQSDRPAPSPSSSSSSSSSSACMASNHFSRFRHYNKGIPAVMLIFFFLCGFVLLCISSNMWIRFPGVDQSPSIYTVQVVNEFPHDPRAFTQVNWLCAFRIKL